MSTLAEIIAEGERQIANYQTMILPHGDAGRLLAVAKAALLVRREASVNTTHVESRCPCVRCQRMRAFDAAAGEGPKP